MAGSPYVTDHYIPQLHIVLRWYMGASQIMFGWFTGVSRIIDNKHSTADVVGGFILGAMIGLVFVFKVPYLSTPPDALFNWA